MLGATGLFLNITKPTTMGIAMKMSDMHSMTNPTLAGVVPALDTPLRLEV